LARSSELAGGIGPLGRFPREASLAVYLGMANLDHSSGRQQGANKKNWTTTVWSMVASYAADLSGHAEFRDGLKSGENSGAGREAKTSICVHDGDHINQRWRGALLSVLFYFWAIPDRLPLG